MRLLMVLSHWQKSAITSRRPLPWKWKRPQLAHVCHNFGTPFVVVRAISDVADQQSHLSFDEFLAVAAKQSSLMVENLVQNWLVVNKNVWRGYPALLFCLPSLLMAAPRVISLSPSNTELAYAAGITPVAVSAWSDYPEAAKKIEQVSNWQGMNLERIVALKPDIVLAWRGGNAERQVNQLQALGIKIVWLDPATVEGVVAALRNWANTAPPRNRQPSSGQTGERICRVKSAVFSTPKAKKFSCNLANSRYLRQAGVRFRTKFWKCAVGKISSLIAGFHGRKSAVNKCLAAARKLLLSPAMKSKSPRLSNFGIPN